MKWFTLVFIISSFSVLSQKNISTQFMGWALYMGNHKLSNKVYFMSEYQWRRADGFQHWQQSLLRLGTEYVVNPKFAVMAGYAWIKTFPYGTQPVLREFNEQRIFEQVNHMDKVGRFELQHRYRIEQRFIEQYAKNSPGDVVQVNPVFRNRIRYRAMVMFPLSRKEMANNTLFLNVNDELFVGVGKGIAKNPIDQNRFIAALGWRFNPQTNVQVGYLNQFVIKSNATDMERNHSLWVSMVYNLDCTKWYNKP
jgi:hypothetical protein